MPVPSTRVVDDPWTLTTMPLSYTLIIKVLRKLGRFVGFPLGVQFFRSSAALVRLVLCLCNRFSSHLNQINSTNGHSNHPRTDPTSPSNVHEAVYMSHLPYLQEAGPHSGSSIESFQLGSSPVSASGSTGANRRTSDSSSEATVNDAGCTSTGQIPHPAHPMDVLLTNVHGDDPTIIAVDPEPMSTEDVTTRNVKPRRGERKLSVSFDPNLPLSPSDLSVNTPHSGSGHLRSVLPITVHDMMSRRYGRKGQADWKMSYRRKALAPGFRDYSEQCREGWVRHVQAEGAQYFYQPELRVLTDVDMYKRKLAEEVEKAAKNLHDAARDCNILLSDDTELVIELEPKRKGDRDKSPWMYYFVDHTAHVVFWVHPMDYKLLVGHVRGVKHLSHLKYTIETQYWMHREMFPLNRPIPLSVLNSLKATLIYAQAEEVTSNMSLAPFDVDELGKLVDLVDRTEEGAKEGQPDVIFVIARLIRIFTDAKFVNFYGQIGARLNADQSVYSEEDDKPSSILPVLDIFLFGSASAHLMKLKGIWVDRTVNYPRWKGFIRKLLAEWNSFTIYSTVMLAVDVSFLGNPGMQVTSAVNPQQRAGLISIYLSLVCVVGSLLVSVLLVGQARGQEGESAKGAAEFMKRMTQSMLGLEALAIMQSVPYALLIWGMLFFVLAVAFIIFGSKETVIIAIISPAWVLVALLCLWPLWGSRQRRASLYNVWMRTIGSLPVLHLLFLKEKPALPTTTTPPSSEE